MGKEYDENDDFSAYEADLEEGIRKSRQARKKAKEERRNKSVADTYKADFDDEPIKVKSSRQKRGEQNQTKYENDIDEISAYNEEPYEQEEAAEEMPREENMGAKSKKAPKKKKSLKKLFITVFVSILCVYAVIMGAFIFITLFGNGDEEVPSTPTEMVKQVVEKTQEAVVGKVPDRTIVLLMVTDEDKTRTDTIMLANYDNVNKRLTMLSIPRDTIVEVSQETYNEMRTTYPEPGKRQMKINAIHHYGASDGVEMLQKEIERMFGIRPDYYVKVDFEGFNYIVDSIGGIEFDVPQDMDYEDPTQDLYIHLKKGKQLLDGDKAQQLVRFRKDNYGHGYAGGDIDRIAVQQAFMKAFMEKALSSDTIFKNLFSYMGAFNKYVTTNATVNDMVRYASVLKSLNMSNVITETLPGDPVFIYGISGYKVSEDEAAAMIYNTFKRPLDEVKQEVASAKQAENAEKSTDKKIQVLNGGYTNGMAGEIQKRFEDKGISVANIDTDNGEKHSETRIIVSRDGIGLDLKDCFDKQVVYVTDPAKTSEAGYDIIVIVGTDEPLTRSGSSSHTSLTDIPLSLNIFSGAVDTETVNTENLTGNYSDFDFDDEDDENYVAPEDENEENGEENEDGENGTSSNDPVPTFVNDREYEEDEDEDEDEDDSNTAGNNTNTGNNSEKEENIKTEPEENGSDNEPEEEEPKEEQQQYDFVEQEVD